MFRIMKQPFLIWSICLRGFDNYFGEIEVSLNIVLLIIGALFLLYGIKQKLKFWIIIGALIVCLGAISAYVDYTASGMDGINDSRVPFVVDHFMS